MDFVTGLTIFVLAIFVGFEIITKIPPTLHTPLMSGSNAISGITIVGALIASGVEDNAVASVLAFLAVFFVFQMLTSGTEEIGWRGYLNEKLMRGRDFYETGWAVGLPWAVWHVPIVLIIFAQQGMEPVAMVGSLAGFGIGIVALQPCTDRSGFTDQGAGEQMRRLGRRPLSG